MYHSLLSFTFMASFIINCCYMHMLFYYVSRADRLVLVKQLVCSCWGKSIFLTPNIPCLPVVLHVGRRPYGLFPTHFGMSVGVILVQLMLIMQLCWWDFMGVASHITRRHSITADFLILALPGFLTHLVHCFLSLKYGSCFIDLWVGAGLHYSVFWPIMI